MNYRYRAIEYATIKKRGKMEDTALILRNQALIMLALSNYLRLTDPIRTTQDCLHLSKAVAETTDRYTELKEINVEE